MNSFEVFFQGLADGKARPGLGGVGGGGSIREKCNTIKEQGNMPRRQQPATPPNLLPIPAGAYKKQYYPHPDTVYYLASR